MATQRTKGAFSGGVPSEGMFSAGAGAAPITPLAGHLAGGGLYLAGYGGYRARPAAGVRDELLARAFVLQAPGDTGGPLVWLSLDLLGIGDKTLQAIRAEAERRLGLSGAVILTSCTHTHSAPDLIGIWGGVPGAYHDYVVSQAVDAIARALETRAPSHLYAGQADLSGANRNRRGWNLTDSKLTVLQLRKEDGSVLATLVNFAAHPVIIGPENRLAAADFAGSLTRAVETEFGGVALFVQGAQGDVSPVQPEETGAFERADRYGERLARAVRQALESEWRPASTLRAGACKVEATVEAPDLQHAFRAGWLAPYYSARFGGSGGEESHDERPHVKLEVWRISLGAGDETVEIACVPGEPTARLGERLQAAMPGRIKLVFGLTPVLFGYLIPADEWMCAPRSAYEETVSLGREAGALVLRAAAAAAAAFGGPETAAAPEARVG